MSALSLQIYSPATPTMWLPTDEASGDLTNRGSATPATLTKRGNPTYRVSNLFAPSGGGVLLGPSNFFGSQSGWLVGDMSYSVAAWFRTISTDAVATYGGGATANVLLGDWSNAVARAFGVHGGVLKYRHFQTSGGTWVGVTGATAVNDGQWHMAGLAYNASTDVVAIYLDDRGTAEATGAATANPGGSSFSSVGAGYGNGTEAGAQDFFDGSMAAVACWSSVLTVTDFQRIYQAGIRSGVGY